MIFEINVSNKNSHSVQFDVEKNTAKQAYLEALEKGIDIFGETPVVVMVKQKP